MNAVAVILEGRLARKVVWQIAYDYSFLWLIDVATVREAPRLTQHEADKLRDCRAALLSIVRELPPLAEPAYPVRYLLSDHVPKKTKPINIPGIGRGNVVLSTKLRPGAKQAPTFARGRCADVANQWADSFCLLCGV